MKQTAGEAFTAHWPEYLMEAVVLGIFMMSAGSFGVLLEHPASIIHQSIPNGVARRALMGLAMGGTAIILILSPWGQRSGAHMNPSVTLAFASLGKIAPWDTVFYIGAQIGGGICGMQLANLLIATPLQHAAVNYVVTAPGPAGWPEALAAEFVISAILMTAVLAVSNSRYSRWTPFVAGSLVAAYILLEAPISGMSMNPARTLGSDYAASLYPDLWIYFIGPPLGMLTAAQVFRAGRGVKRVYCAKLHHDNDAGCIFRCNYPQKGEA